MTWSILYFGNSPFQSMITDSTKSPIVYSFLSRPLPLRVDEVKLFNFQTAYIGINNTKRINSLSNNFSHYFLQFNFVSFGKCFISIFFTVHSPSSLSNVIFIFSNGGRTFPPIASYFVTSITA